jgi:uncharacterized protein YbjT (DUF2867 family)
MNSIARFIGAVAVISMLSFPVLADGVLVFGGTGRLGSYTVKELLASDEKVIVFSRQNSNRNRLKGLDVTYVVGDLLDQDSVERAFRAVQPRIVIDTSAMYGASYEKAAQNIVSGAKLAGVEQIILHGSVGAGENMELFPSISAPALVTVLRDKGRAETVLIDSGLNYTIIRNGLIEYDDSLSSGKARITEDQTILGRITRQDLAAVTMECFDAKWCGNKIFHATDDTQPLRLPTENTGDE